MRAANDNQELTKFCVIEYGNELKVNIRNPKPTQEKKLNLFLKQLLKKS